MHLDLQTLITAALVAACGLHAAWTLMPAAWRRQLSGRFEGPLPLGTSPAGGGCNGCEGCGSGPAQARTRASTTPGVAVIQIVRRPPR